MLNFGRKSLTVANKIVLDISEHALPLDVSNANSPRCDSDAKNSPPPVAVLPHSSIKVPEEQKEGDFDNPETSVEQNVPTSKIPKHNHLSAHPGQIWQDLAILQSVQLVDVLEVGLLEGSRDQEAKKSEADKVVVRKELLGGLASHPEAEADEDD
jgi:hypothetical protein